jgi:hypothetical protein
VKVVKINLCESYGYRIVTQSTCPLGYEKTRSHRSCCIENIIVVDSVPGISVAG